MQVSALSVILEEISDCYSSAGAAAQAKDFKKMLEILKGHENESLEDFVEFLKPLADKKSIKSNQKEIDQEKIASYARLLADAKTDQNNFDKAFRNLETSSKKMPKAELDGIANKYTKTDSKYKSKQAALEAIEKKFIELVRFEQKMEVVDKMTPW